MGVKIKDYSGQMTVEFVVAFPVMIMVALVATNALLFFSECAAFDRIVQESARIHLASPAYGQSLEQSSAAAEQEISKRFDKDYLSFSTTYSQSGSGHISFTANLEFSPTLFGMGLRSEFFGLSLPSLHHSSTAVIDSYKPGVLL